MNYSQAKRLYRLVGGICIAAFLILGFQSVKEDVWREKLGKGLVRDFYREDSNYYSMVESGWWKIRYTEGGEAPQEFLETLGLQSRDDLSNENLADDLADTTGSRESYRWLTEMEYERILGEEGEAAAQEFLQLPPIDKRLRRAWRSMKLYRTYESTLALMSMVLFSAIAYWIVWFLGERSYRYIRGGGEAPK